MPLFAIMARDKPDHLETRMATRDSHLAHLGALGDALRVAGPIVDEGGRPVGSLIVVEMGSLAEAEAFAEADPYSKAGLFGAVEVTGWNALLGDWVADGEDGAGEDE